jgi:hypothetical protein
MMYQVLGYVGEGQGANGGNLMEIDRTDSLIFAKQSAFQAVKSGSVPCAMVGRISRSALGKILHTEGKIPGSI